jgi:dephospho-CoA kinase
MRADPFFVAVTGGIGAGKSEVTRRFEALGVAVIDADVIARELVAPGQPALQAIRQQFGGAVLAQDGKLDRRRMRELIFPIRAKKQLLEALLHPLIAMVMQQQARAASGPYVMLAIRCSRSRIDMIGWIAYWLSMRQSSYSASASCAAIASPSRRLMK